MATTTPVQGDKDKGRSPGLSTSRTITDTIVGEHEHTIVGYSLIKGIGDGEPIASERFTVGGHEWVLLFYPDGKRSSTELHNINGHHLLHGAQVNNNNNRGADEGAVQGGQGAQGPQGAQAAPAAQGAQGAPLDDGPMARQDRRMEYLDNMLINPNLEPIPGYNPANPRPGALPVPALPQPAANPNPHPNPHPNPQAHAPQHPASTSNDYCALFVALIGEGDAPQGVVNTSEGRVVRAFHRFTLVDQSGRGHDITKGRRRDQGAVKISCARQDPNARNCHGYRKFVKKSILEDPGRGLLVNDTLVIKYQIELVVSTGGALSRHTNPAKFLPPQITVPPPSLGLDLASILDSGTATDIAFEVDGEVMPAHKIILQARSPVFKALLTGPMKEGHEETVVVQDVRAPVFRALLHFAYSDALPDELQGSKLDVPMAQHLLAAADRFQLVRLRCICEQRLCDTVEVDTVATTLALAEQNNARELKRVCLEFVSKHLQSVMATEGYVYMTQTCPQLQSELLSVIATASPQPLYPHVTQVQHVPHERGQLVGRRGSQPRGNGQVGGGGGGERPLQVGHVHGLPDESSTEGQIRRVRARRELP